MHERGAVEGQRRHRVADRLAGPGHRRVHAAADLGQHRPHRLRAGRDVLVDRLHARSLSRVESPECGFRARATPVSGSRAPAPGRSCSPGTPTAALAEAGRAQQGVVVRALGAPKMLPAHQPDAVGVRRRVVGRQHQVGAQPGLQHAGVVVEGERRALVGGDDGLAGTLQLGDQLDQLVAPLPRLAVEQWRRGEQGEHQEQRRGGDPGEPGERPGARRGQHADAEQPGEQVARQVQRPYQFAGGEQHERDDDPRGGEHPRRRPRARGRRTHSADDRRPAERMLRPPTRRAPARRAGRRSAAGARRCGPRCRWSG